MFLLSLRITMSLSYIILFGLLSTYEFYVLILTTSNLRKKFNGPLSRVGWGGGARVIAMNEHILNLP